MVRNTPSNRQTVEHLEAVVVMDPITLTLIGISDGSRFVVTFRSFEKLPLPCSSPLRKSRRRPARSNWPQSFFKVVDLLKQSCALRRLHIPSYQGAVSSAVFGDCVPSDDGLVESASSDHSPFLFNLAAYSIP